MKIKVYYIIKVFIAQSLLLGNLNAYAQGHECSPEKITVKLSKVSQDISSVDNFPNLNNLMFEEASYEYNFPPNSNKEKVAIVSQPKNNSPIVMGKFEAYDGNSVYALDTDYDQDFEDNEFLELYPKGTYEVAEQSIRLLGDDDKLGSELNFHFVITENYDFVSHGSYLTGHIQYAEQNIPIKIINKSTNEPLFKNTSNLIALIDINQDEKFEQDWSIPDDGRIMPSEEFSLKEPILLFGKSWVFELSENAEQLSLMQTEVDSASVTGFYFGDFELSKLDSSNFKLEDINHRFKLIEFWSINCPFSEKARTGINKIQDQFSDALIVISTPREQNLSVVKNHLEEHPKSGLQIHRHSNLWKTHNPEPVSPLYYLIDKNNVILMKIRGASAVKIIEEKLKSILTNTQNSN